MVTRCRGTSALMARIILVRVRPVCRAVSKQAPRRLQPAFVYRALQFALRWNAARAATSRPDSDGTERNAANSNRVFVRSARKPGLKAGDETIPDC